MTNPGEEDMDNENKPDIGQNTLPMNATELARQKDKFHIGLQYHKSFKVYIIAYCILAFLFLVYSVSSLALDKYNEGYYWKEFMTTDPTVAEEARLQSADATVVTVGTRITDIRSFNIADASFDITGSVWFKWHGDKDLDPADNFNFFKGKINSMKVSEEIHDGKDNYQLVDFDVTISKNFWTKRFPLESHQLRMYIISDYQIGDVVFKNDSANSQVSKTFSINGFQLRRSATGDVFFETNTNYGQPGIKDTAILSEHVTQLEIVRQGLGLYLICFISLFATVFWALLSLFMCTYHRVDPIGMIPGALFGAVANVMIGVNRIPTVQAGLLLDVNIFGIATILVCAMAIIGINRIRSYHKDRAYAAYIGIKLFRIITIITVIGNIAMPLAAYMF